jgi:hypothetical protein
VIQETVSISKDFIEWHSPATGFLNPGHIELDDASYRHFDR